MALIGEPSLLCDQSQRLIRPPHQRFCPFEPSLRDVASWANPNRLLERSTEVVPHSPDEAGILSALATIVV